jgi:hypothetical protein
MRGFLPTKMSVKMSNESEKMEVAEEESGRAGGESGFSGECVQQSDGQEGQEGGEEGGKRRSGLRFSFQFLESSAVRCFRGGGARETNSLRKQL